MTLCLVLVVFNLIASKDMAYCYKDTVESVLWVEPVHVNAPRVSLFSPTRFTGGDLWFALCLSVSLPVCLSVCHTFLDPAITLKVLHIFS